MRTIRSAVLATAAVMTGVLGSVPAAAAPGDLYWINCVQEAVQESGTIDESTFSVDASGNGQISAQGTLIPCRAPRQDEAYVVAHYYPDGTASGVGQLYPPYYGDSTYSTTATTIRSGTFAICLVTSRFVRLDCWTIDWLDGRAVLGESLPVDAPEVDVLPATDVKFRPPTDPPHCPGCLEP